MIKKLKQFFAVLAVSGALLAPLAAAPAALAQNANCSGTQSNITGCLETGACLDTTAANCQAAADPNGSVNRIITTVINIFSLIVGVVSVIMIIIGGLRYITSGGDSGNVTNAKNTILYAIVGLVIVALAQVIVHFVLNRVTGAQ
jgi:hypothetical protein